MWADALPGFGERRSRKYSDQPDTYAPAYAGLCKIRTTALSVGTFQIGEPYASLAVTRVGNSRPCRLRSRTTARTTPRRRKESKTSLNLSRTHVSGARTQLPPAPRPSPTLQANPS